MNFWRDVNLKAAGERLDWDGPSQVPDNPFKKGAKLVMLPLKTRWDAGFMRRGGSVIQTLVSLFCLNYP